MEICQNFNPTFDELHLQLIKGQTFVLDEETNDEIRMMGVAMEMTSVYGILLNCGWKIIL